MGKNQRRKNRNRKLGRPPLHAHQISAMHRAKVRVERCDAALDALDEVFGAPGLPGGITVDQQMAFLNLLDDPCMDCQTDHSDESLGCLHECHEE